MIEKTILDMLTQDSVSLKKQQYVTQDGKEYAIGEVWRKAYINSVRGRQEVEDEVAEPYKSVILMMWGGKPTVSDIAQ